MGHIIENNTIAPSPTKVKAVQLEPKNIKQLHLFLGLMGYFQIFILQYASFACISSDLLQKSPNFEFGPDQKQVLHTQCTLLSNSPILHIFVLGSDFEAHNDTSKYGFGTTFMKMSPMAISIQHRSKKTSPQEEKLSNNELEVLAVIEALKQFYIYLHGTRYHIISLQTVKHSRRQWIRKTLH